MLYRYTFVLPIKISPLSWKYLHQKSRLGRMQQRVLQLLDPEFGVVLGHRTFFGGNLG